MDSTGSGLFVVGLYCYESVPGVGGLYGEWIVVGLCCYESVLGVGGLYWEWIVCCWFILL